MSTARRVAVVIPTLDEDDVIEAAVHAAQAHADLVIVADGGSHDETVRRADAAGALIVGSRAGRGVQLNAGARRALDQGADLVVFLHADTRLPEGARHALEAAVGRGATCGGFLVLFDEPPTLLRWGTRLINWRTRRFRVPLGDQAQWTTREAFERLGGFKEWPILEDLDFVRRSRRLEDFQVVERSVTTAARRFRQRGVVRTVATNWLIWLLFACGVEPHRLVGLYRKVR